MTRTADCVLQTTATIGTGTLALGLAVSGYRSLADAITAGGLADGDVVPYRIETVDVDGIPTGAWEVGDGTVGGAGTTLTRNTVRASSNAGSLVSFAAGTKYVFLTELPGVPDRNYVHTQGSASATWTVAHNLGKYPSVSVVDSAGTVFRGEVNYIDVNSLTISFSAAFGGSAYLN